jgi:hypothetical protein
VSTPELRSRLRAYYEESGRIAEERERIEDAYWAAKLDERIPWRVCAAMKMPPLPSYPEFPEECRGMTCGAKTRAGTPCKRKDLYISGRCKLHGGLSTGPTTEKGKRKAARNGPQPKRKRTP